MDADVDADVELFIPQNSHFSVGTSKQVDPGTGSEPFTSGKRTFRPDRDPLPARTQPGSAL